MPHLVVLYTGNLGPQAHMSALCRKLADVMVSAADERGTRVFPTGGVRVLAYPAAEFAVADGKRDYAFVYLNLRMAQGRGEDVRSKVGQTLLGCAKEHFEKLLTQRLLGITLQIDEGAEVFGAKVGNIHPLFPAG